MQIFTDFSILCESALIDEKKNSLNLMSVIDGAQVNKLPAALSSCHLVNRFRILDNKELDVIPINFKLIRPDGSAVDIDNPDKSKSHEINIKKDIKVQTSGIILNLSVDAEQEGIHSIKTYYNDEEIATQSFNVELVKE